MKKQKDFLKKMAVASVSGALTGAVNSKETFYSWDKNVLVLNILGKPSAKLDAIGKVKGTQLKVSVTAAPVSGKATDHMVRFLAGQFGVATSDIEVVFGRMNVNKQLRITAPKRLPSVIEMSS